MTQRRKRELKKLEKDRRETIMSNRREQTLYTEMIKHDRRNEKREMRHGKGKRT